MKDAMALFGDEFEVRDRFATAAMRAMLTAPATVDLVRSAPNKDPHRSIAATAFDLAETMISERRRRTIYTCTTCGKVALKPGNERCPECAKHMCVRCRKPVGELHHICIREIGEEL